MNKLNTQEDLERLGDTEEKLNSILDSIAGIHWWKDKDGVYRGCNQAMVDALGLKSKDDIIGKTDYDLPWAEQADALVANDRVVMETGCVQRGKEEYVRGQDGAMRVFMVAKSPLRNHSKEIVGTVGNSIDITLQKKLEKELAIAIEKAEAANELKSKFIQNMQHDIRTPLSGAYTYLKNLAQEQSDPEEKKFITLMAASLGQLVNTCNEIVDFNNIDYLGDTVKLEPVNTKRFVYRVRDLYSAAAHTRGVELILIIEPDVPERLKLDKLRVSRALLNLTGNALKFTDKGSVTLQMSLLSLTENMVTVAFEVKDTGIGIPNDQINKIFDKFVRLNPSNTAKYKGSGLGLYYVKKFIDDMGGKLEVESEEGKGSTFRIILTLPIPSVDEKEEFAFKEIDTFDEEAVLHEMKKFPDERFNTEKEKSELNYSGLINENSNNTNHKPQLLLVEDDIILQRTIGKTFTDKGCEIVVKVDSVSKACEAIRAREYDLVICDLGIHEGTGIDVMNWAKSDKTHPNQNTPFVVLTANNDPETKQKALDSGFLQVFQKPLESEEAKKIIDIYIKERSFQPAQIPSNKIIDIDASLEIVGDIESLKELFYMLSKSIIKDKVTFQELYDKNDIQETLNLLLRLAGTFAYFVAPRLEAARAELAAAVKQAQWLTTITPLYENFYKEIDNFLSEYEKLKQAGKL